METWRESFAIAAADGIPIVVHRWHANAAPRGIVQISHGMGEHALRYHALACCLAKAGYVVYANDHRGHGQTVRDRLLLGDLGPNGLRSTVEDMFEVTSFAHRIHRDAPVALVGVSMGSYATQLYALEYGDQLAGIALTGGSALDLRISQLGHNGWQYARNNALFESAECGFDWLSRDRAVVKAYVDDPMCGFGLSLRSQKSLNSIGALLSDQSALRRMRSDLPILLFSGEKDPCNAFLKNFYALVERYECLGLSDVTAKMYPEARHDLFNELNRDEVIGDFLDWLARVTSMTAFTSRQRTANFAHHNPWHAAHGRLH
jgi:alpha-beta hydrolase superfamily lysophospholipase